MTWRASGHDNWFRLCMEPNFDVEILKPAQQCYTNFIDAGNHVANLIANRWHDKPLYLTLSGGLDSEFVANRLKENKIDFTPVIFRLPPFNNYETWYADYWCWQNNVKPLIIEYNIDQYTQAIQKFSKWGAELKNFNLVTQMIVYDFINSLNGYVIYCAGDMQFDVNSKDQFYLHTFDFISDIASVGQHPTSFYMYAPEILLSYITGYNLSLSENYNKILAYKLSPRPKINYQVDLALDSRWFELKHHLSVQYNVPLETQHKSCYFGTKEQIIKKLTR